MGQKEHSMVMDQLQAKNTLAKLVWFVKNVNLVLGGLESVAANPITDPMEGCVLPKTVSEQN